jgi:hypothetical protein
MEKIRNLMKNPLATGIAGLIIGLIIGLPLLGWGLWPVKWKDADASYLRQDLKAQYLCMVVDSYKLNPDAALASARLDSMGLSNQDAAFALDSLQTGGCSYAPTDETVLSLKTALLALPQTSTVATSGTNTTVPTAVSSTTGGLPTLATSTTKKSSGNGLPGILAGILCVLFLGIGGLLIYMFFFKNRKPKEQIPPTSNMHDFENPLEEPDFTQNYTQPSKTTAAVSDVPAAHFMTTYVIGDDLYDDSFSIDTAKGDFLGECGVGISDIVGVGDPKKVSAFEVWLFDKNDTQTVTKVLMSARAMNDPATRQRMASKGEPVLIEPGQQILLETPSLQLQAKVIELVYGQGALPAGSYFERLTLELSVWPK